MFVNADLLEILNAGLPKQKVKNQTKPNPLTILILIYPYWNPQGAV